MVTGRDQRRDEFTQLLCQYERQIFSFILALVWNMHDSEDLYQQTVMTLWDKFGDFQQGTNFPRWACSVARLVVLEFQRKRRKQSVSLTADTAALLADEHSVASATDLVAPTDMLIDCMKQLSSADQQLVSLHYCDDRPVTMIAKELGRPAQSIYNSLFRIRRSLFDCMRRAAARRGEG